MKRFLLIGASALFLAWAANANAEHHKAGTDADLDGVPDSEDWCLGTPRGERVGPDGCASFEIGNWSDAAVCDAGMDGAHPAGADHDRDGVPDSEDWCPQTPDGVRVGANGCADGEIAVTCRNGATPVEKSQPMRIVPATRDNDADGDGVPDADDRCPGTARGIPVDRNGCALIEKVVLKGINFDTASAKLKPAAGDTLRSVAAAMKVNKKLKVEVRGYTDSVGTDERNLGLSERRAKSVKEFLVKEGVAEDRLTAKGFGKADPTDTNDTPAGRANNRRVGFKVTDD